MLTFHPGYTTYVLYVMWLIEDIVSEQKRTHRLLSFVWVTEFNQIMKSKG